MQDLGGATARQGTCSTSGRVATLQAFGGSRVASPKQMRRRLKRENLAVNAAAASAAK